MILDNTRGDGRSRYEGNNKEMAKAQSKGLGAGPRASKSEVEVQLVRDEGQQERNQRPTTVGKQ